MNKKKTIKMIEGVFPTEIPASFISYKNDVDVELKQINSFLRNRVWKELKLVDLHHYDQDADVSSILAFLPPEYYRYYLPAFLIISMSSCEEIGLICDAVISSLCPWHDPSDIVMHEHINQKHNGFSKAQVDTIINYLVFMKSHYAFPKEDPTIDLEIIKSAIENMKSFL